MRFRITVATIDDVRRVFAGETVRWPPTVDLSKATSHVEPDAPGGPHLVVEYTPTEDDR